MIPDLLECTSVRTELFCALVTAFSPGRFDFTKINDNEKTFVNDPISPQLFSAYLLKKKAHYTGFLLRLQLKNFSFNGVSIAWWS